MGNRIDHCHIKNVLQYSRVWVSGWTYGVADHNVIEYSSTFYAFYLQENKYGGPSQDYGNGAWSDYPRFGSDQFFFIESNTIINTGPKNWPFTDGRDGSRFVVRYNYIKNGTIADHGTEGGVDRGARAKEVYFNTFQIVTGALSPGGQRSGTCIFHDNAVTGNEPNYSMICRLTNYRETTTRPSPVWGLADGTSPWDLNDTEGNGTSVAGHPPFLFDSGTDTSSVNSQGVLHDSTKSWATNQWIDYSIKNTNPASASYRLGSYITSNTSNTITYAVNDSIGGGHLIFNAGDTYEIHRVLIQLDQNGRGKGDQITGVPQPINTTTGTPSWNHGALEPCYSWNNIYTPNQHALGFGSGSPTTKANRDYYNLGGGLPVDTTPPQVASTYTAALNGVDYVGTFVYPHPLVSGTQPPPSATTKSQQHLQKKKKNSKNLKRRNWPKKSASDMAERH
jgi:hypothetical protein